jgi:hypothetical protein
MNPLIRKETRLLLPAWIAALVAALAVVTLPVWPGLDWWNVEPVLFIIFVAAILSLALLPFGQEMSYGTFGLLLVQPEERRRFWMVKTGLLAVALVSTWMLFALCLCSLHWEARELAWWLKGTALMTLLAFSGGLWTTLLPRDVVISFFCAWLVPTAICAATFATVGHWVDPREQPVYNHPLLRAGGVCGGRLFVGATTFSWRAGCGVERRANFFDDGAGSVSPVAGLRNQRPTKPVDSLG